LGCTISSDTDTAAGLQGTPRAASTGAVFGVRAGPVLAAVAVMSVWGATPTFSKIALRTVTPFDVAVLRTLLAGAVVAPILAARRQAPPRAGHDRLLLTTSAISGFVLFPLLYTIGQQRTSAVHGAMILAALPIMTGAYAHVVERRVPQRRWMVGCVLALAGELALVSIRVGGAHASTRPGDLLITASVFVVAVGYVAGARLSQRGYPSQATTFWGVLVGAVLLAPLMLISVATGGRPGGDWAAWAAIAFLAVVTSIIGYVGWYWALARGGIARIAPIQFLQPFSGLVLAAVLLGEQLTPPLLAASLVILCGVAITQWRRGGPPPAAPADPAG
jgi:drug/metabolite transporter (DMT)-like permease